jgi:hypothetical protein
MTLAHDSSLNIYKSSIPQYQLHFIYWSKWENNDGLIHQFYRYKRGERSIAFVSNKSLIADVVHKIKKRKEENIGLLKVRSLLG